MLKLHVVQAFFGDCFLLEYGTAAQPRFLLIDGGPPSTYDRHLRGILEAIGGAGHAIDLVALSHVDNDHIIGLLDYFADLRANTNPSLPTVSGLWHNSFARTLDSGGGIESRLKTLVTNTRAAVMNSAGAAVNGIGEGNGLRVSATVLGIPINPGFPGDLIIVDTAPAPFRFENLTITITGPTQANLNSLQADWEAWLDEHEDEVGTDDPLVMANSDRSIPNLSSISFLAAADGIRILFTGDGRSDHLLDGLGKAGLLNSHGRLHVNVLKLAHHGSNRNTTKTFFKTVTADQYIASANGKDDNPDLATLIWIVEAAKDQNRTPQLFVTNRTPSVIKLLDEYPEDDYGYTLKTLQEGAHSQVFDLA